ncbi:hypothetical protein Tco_1465318 [Tanacetum coccineum]
MISGRSLLLYVRIVMMSRPRTHIPSRPRLGCDKLPHLSGYSSLILMHQSDTEIPGRHVSPTTSTPEIPTAPILPAPSAIVARSSEFPLAPVVAPIGIRRRRAILIRPGEDIPIALKYTSHHLDHFTSGSSSSHSSSDHSSSGHSISSHSLFGHTPPDTTDIDSSTPPRFVHPSLARTLRCSEAYLCWRSSPLSTMSPAATRTSSIHATRALVPSRADLLPPRKRFRDSISLEDYVKRTLIRCVKDDVKRVEDSLVQYREHLEQVEEGLQNIYDHVKIPLPEDEDIKTDIENMTINRSGMTPEVIEELVNRRVEEALAAYEVTRADNALEAENQSQNGSDGDNGNGGDGNDGNGNDGNGNDGNGNDGNGNSENGDGGWYGH